EAVAIDVTGAADGPAAVIEPPLAVEAEAVGAVERTELDGGGKPAGLAEHHVGRSRTGAVRVCLRCADDQVIEAVAVDVTGTADGPPAHVVPRLAIEAEAVGAVERAERDRRGKPAGLAEHHVARPGTEVVRIGIRRADDQVVEAVAVDVAGTADGKA